METRQDVQRVLIKFSNLSSEMWKFWVFILQFSQLHIFCLRSWHSQFEMLIFFDFFSETFYTQQVLHNNFFVRENETHSLFKRFCGKNSAKNFCAMPSQLSLHNFFQPNLMPCKQNEKFNFEHNLTFSFKFLLRMPNAYFNSNAV